jgi:hypothetical protein
MDALYEWLLRKARSPSGKVAAAVLISTLFCAAVSTEFMTGPAEVAMVLGGGAGMGLLAGVLLTMADHSAERRRGLDLTGPSLGQRITRTVVLIGMGLGLISLMFGILAIVANAVSFLFR